MLRPSNALIAHIYKLAGAYQEELASDRELLNRYIETQDENAFSALMVRHGGMVWHICRCILGKTEDVEEAFQTTFLALACKASKIRTEEVLIGWIQQVARRTALAARRKAKSQQRLKDGLKDVARSGAAAETKQDEACEELYTEMAKLPEKQRVALVLHYLECKTQAEVASILGLTESSVRDRLERGKATLQKRLSQHGVVGGAAMVGALLETMAASAAIPRRLIQQTVKTATAFRNGTLSGGVTELARQVLKHTPSTMPWWKTGWIIALISVSGFGVGVGCVAWKMGYFGADAEVSAAVTGPAKLSRETNGESQPPRLDLYGDPLPQGALARLGTLRLRHSGCLDRAGLPDPTKGTVVFSRDGKSLFTEDNADPICLFDIGSGKLLRQFGTRSQHLAKQGQVYFGGNHVMCLSPDGNIMASWLRKPDKPGKPGKENGCLTFWDVATGRLRSQWLADSHELIAAAAYSHDGKKFMTVNHWGSAVWIWDVATGKKLAERPLAQKSPSQYFAFSPGGKTLISLSPHSRLATLWDVATGGILRKFQHNREDAEVDYAVFSPDDRFLATASAYGETNSPCDGAVHVWDVAAGKELRKVGFDRAGTTSIAFTPNGKILATGSAGGPIRIWETSTGKELRCCQNYRSHVCSLAFSPDGSLLASGAGVHDHASRVWNVASGEEITRFLGQQGGVIRSVVFSPDGNSLISGGGDGLIGVWDVETAKERLPPLRAGDFQSFATLLPDGKTIASIGNVIKPSGEEFWRDRRRSSTAVRFWDLTTGKLLRQFEGREGFIHSGLFSLNGKQAVFISLTPRASCSSFLWDLTAGKEVRKLYAKILLSHQVAISPHSEMVVIGDEVDGALSYWDAMTGRELVINGERYHSPELTSMTFSSDGLLLATGALDEKLIDKIKHIDDRHYPSTILLWRFRRDKATVRVHKVDIHSMISRDGYIRALTFSPDGKILASTGEKGVVRLWETITGKERTHFEGHQGGGLCLAFSPDGRRLASGGGDTSILVWDVTGRQGYDRTRPALLSAHHMELSWEDLADVDATRAGRAIWALASAREQAVSFLEKRLVPIFQDPEAKEQIARRIAELSDNRFRVRAAAEVELKKWGKTAAPALYQALNAHPSLEARKRMEQLLRVQGKEVPSGKVLRELRAIEALEHIGTGNARHLLDRLSHGDPGCLQTKEAKAAFSRLQRMER